MSINIRISVDIYARNIKIAMVNLHFETNEFELSTSRHKNSLGWYCIKNRNTYTNFFSVRSVMPKHLNIWREKIRSF